MMSNRAVLVMLAAALGMGAPHPAAAGDTDPEALVNALNAVFGANPGKRAAHTHGFCVKGAFVPSDEAGKLSKAPHLSGKGPWPVVARFSMGGGNPEAPTRRRTYARDRAASTSAGQPDRHGVISAPVFVARTPAKFPSCCRRRRRTRTGSAPSSRPTRIDATNPGSTHARCLSYATTSYFGVHTFTLTNAAGKADHKGKLIPKTGEVGL